MTLAFVLPFKASRPVRAAGQVRSTLSSDFFCGLPDNSSAVFSTDEGLVANTSLPLVQFMVWADASVTQVRSC